MRVIVEQADDTQEEMVIIRCKKLGEKHLKAIKILEATYSVVAYKQSEMHRLDIDEIYYFEAVDNKTFVYTAHDVLEYKQKIADAEATLGDDFVRVSRTMVLNWQKIASLKPMLNGRMEATLLNNEKQIISRQYVPDLKRKFIGATKREA